MDWQVVFQMYLLRSESAGLCALCCLLLKNSPLEQAVDREHFGKLLRNNPGYFRK